MTREAIVLAGGLGTRLQSVVADRAKPVAEVAERPFVEWLLRALVARGVTRAVLAVGHLAGSVRQALAGLELGLELRFSEEAEPLGTGGAARLALQHTEGERVLVLNGDSYCPFDPAPLDQALNGGPQVAIWLTRMDDSSNYGSVEVEGDRVRAFREKSPDAGPGLINAGIYLFERTALAALPEGPRSLERDVFPDLVSRGLLSAVEGPGPFVDIGTPESYRTAAETIASELAELRS